MAADLVLLTAEIIDIPSVSHDEAEMANYVEQAIVTAGALEHARIGDNVVAWTSFGRPTRVLLAGHLDTVPPAGNERARIEGDRLYGIGATDMKGGVAVELELSRTLTEPAFDLTYVFYACEEVGRADSGLLAIVAERPDLLDADAAILLEPTGAVVEAGCQGVMRLTLTTHGKRSHVARPWTGLNAIHRMGAALVALSNFDERRPVIDGCEYRESLQAVNIEGGVAGNVVPDRAVAKLSYRFAPDRDTAGAFTAIESLVGPALDASLGDSLDIEEVADPAPPAMGHPVIAGLVESSGAPARAKLGWTDVSYFAGRGVPAANFGPGDPELTHRPDEFVTREELERAYSTLYALLSSPGA